MTVDEAQDLLRRAMTASVPKSMRPKPSFDIQRGAVADHHNTIRARAIRDECRAEVWAMRDDGLFIRDIAEKLGRSHAFVWRILKEPRPD